MSQALARQASYTPLRLTLFRSSRKSIGWNRAAFPVPVWVMLISIFAFGRSLSYSMIPGPYESNQRLRTFFYTLGHQQAFIFREVSCTTVERLQWIILSFSGGAGPCSHSIFGIGIAIAENAPPHLDRIVAAEEVNGRGE